MSDKQYYGAGKYEDNHLWLYFSQSKSGWMCKVCKKYPYSCSRTGGAFSVKPYINTDHPSHAFWQYKNSKRHLILKNKITEASCESILDKLIIGAQKKSFNTIHSNNLYLHKTNANKQAMYSFNNIQVSGLRTLQY